VFKAGARGLGYYQDPLEMAKAKATGDAGGADRADKGAPPGKKRKLADGQVRCLKGGGG
jgi:hypothetical protein